MDNGLKIMNNKLSWYFFFSICFCIVSCTNGDKSNFVPAQPSVVPAKSDSIEVWRRNDTVSSQDFVASETTATKYIFLQSDSPKSVVGGIDQIIVDDSTFTIIDKSITEKIVVFNKDGDYMRLIGSKGKARGEYIGLGCASKTKEGHIGITDRLSSNLIIYSPTGETIDEFRMNMLMPHSMVIKDNLILGSYPGYLPSSEFRLKWTDFEGKVIGTAFPFTSKRQYVAGTLLEDPNGDVFFNYPLNDTIFKIENLKITPHTIMNIHDCKLTDDFIKATENLENKDYISKLINDENIVNLVKLIDCGNKWLVDYQKGKNAYTSIISDKGENRTNYLKSQVSHADKTAKMMLPEKFIGYYNGNLIGYIDTEAFALMDENQKTQYLKRIRENSVNTPESDDEILTFGNLILCLYRLN